jgi:hypothetical protein
MRAPSGRLIQGMIAASLIAAGAAHCPGAQAGNGLSSDALSAEVLSGDVSGGTPLDRLIDRFAGFVLPPSPTEALDAVSPEAGIFWRLIADCGYRVTEVVTESGILPKLKVRLERTLELAEEDRTWIGRRLDDWAAEDSGLRATLSRRVVIALLEASEDPRFEAVGVDIALSPLPTATFRLAPHVLDLPSDLPAPGGGRAAHGP